MRVDCQPDMFSKSKDICETRGCVWDEKASENSDKCYISQALDIGMY